MWKLDWSVPASTSHLKGKTGRCHSTFNFASDWNITHSENHWANEDTTVDYINNIIAPYLQQVRSSLHLRDDHPVLAIYDCFRGQVTESVSTLLEENNIHVIVVPVNCTGHFQPLDLSLNKAVKDFYAGSFRYGTQRTSSVNLMKLILLTACSYSQSASQMLQ